MGKTRDREVLMDRRGTTQRRGGAERRKNQEPVAVERRRAERRKVPRRRQIDPTTCERDYTADEIEFMHALDAYKRSSGRMFPTCSEILEVIRDLGYARMPENGTTPSSLIGDAPTLEAESPADSDE